MTIVVADSSPLTNFRVSMTLVNELLVEDAPRRRQRPE